MRSESSLHRTLWAAALASVAALSGGVAEAGIVSSGDVKPPFNLPGPGVTQTTNLGVFVGDAAAGTLTIDDDSTLNAEFMVLGAQLTAGNSGTVHLENNAALNLVNGLDIGEEAPGLMRVFSDSSIRAQFIRFGGLVGGSGIADFQSADVETGFLDVGALGGGQLVVQGESVVRVIEGLGINPGVRLGDQVGSLGTALITGPLTEFHVEGGSLEIGDDGAGIFTVSNGASVEMDRQLFSARQSTSTGTLEFTGPGTTVTSLHQATIGTGGTSGLTISAGALLDSRRGPSPTGSSGNIGFAPGGDGDVTITDLGSRWVNDGTLNVGFEGDGTLDIASGGLAQSVDGAIARLPGSSGVVNVTGAGSRWEIAQGLYVGGRPATSAAGAAGEAGPGGTGLLTVGPGAGVDAGGSMTLFPDGALDVSPGGSATVGAGATPAAAAGTVVVRPGGTLAGSGQVIGDVLNGGGIVAPGHSPGRLSIDGDYVQTDTGALDLEIAGLLPAVQHDQLAVTGDVALDGTLNLIFIDEFAPRQGDTFELLDAGGTYTEAGLEVNIVNLQPGFQYDLQFREGALALIALNDGVFVPEPAALPVLALATLLLRRRTCGRAARRRPGALPGASSYRLTP